MRPDPATDEGLTAIAAVFARWWLPKWQGAFSNVLRSRGDPPLAPGEWRSDLPHWQKLYRESRAGSALHFPLSLVIKECFVIEQSHCSQMGKSDDGV